MKLVYLLCSGPSAELPPEPCVTATVNGGLRLIHNPHFYGLFENEAAENYGAAAAALALAGGTVYARFQAKVRAVKAADGARFPGIIVPSDFGPEGFRRFTVADLDTQHGPVWCGSGVLMLQLLAHLAQPEIIVISGLDGYWPGAEYHPNVPALPGRPARTPTWCAAWNNWSAEAIEFVTNHYVGTQFVFRKRPLNWRDSWKATIL